MSQNLKLANVATVTIPDHSSPPGIRQPWSLASLRPAPPIYALKLVGKNDTNDSNQTNKIPSKIT